METTQPITDGEDFYMYRGYKTKEEALNVAKILSTFIPYYKYPTKILVHEFDCYDGKSLVNKRSIKKYSLKDESGHVVKR